MLETGVILKTTLSKLYFISIKINVLSSINMSHNALIILEDTKISTRSSRGVCILEIHFQLYMLECVCVKHVVLFLRNNFLCDLENH